MLTAGTSRQAIRGAIEAAGMSQEEVAERLSVSATTMSRWLNGHSDPSFDRLEALARAIDQPIVLTFGDTEEAPAPWWAQRLMTRSEVLEMVEGVESRVTAAITGGQTAEEIVDQFVDRMLADLREHAPQLFAGGAPSDAPSAG